jgi:putative endonuclease
MERTNRTILGRVGEAAASAWLSARGYQVLGQNVRTRFGEIDLVVREGEVMVFVEVKTRRGSGFGHPADAIGPRKQRRLTRLAAAYLHHHRMDGASVRFDVVAVLVAADGQVTNIEHMPDAFHSEGSPEGGTRR